MHYSSDKIYNLIKDLKNLKIPEIRQMNFKVTDKQIWKWLKEIVFLDDIENKMNNKHEYYISQATQHPDKQFIIANDNIKWTIEYNKSVSNKTGVYRLWWDINDDPNEECPMWEIAFSFEDGYIEFNIYDLDHDDILDMRIIISTLAMAAYDDWICN